MVYTVATKCHRDENVSLKAFHAMFQNKDRKPLLRGTKHNSKWRNQLFCYFWRSGLCKEHLIISATVSFIPAKPAVTRIHKIAVPMLMNNTSMQLNTLNDSEAINSTSKSRKIMVLTSYCSQFVSLSHFHSARCCSNRDNFQVWCNHHRLERVLQGTCILSKDE